VRLWRALCHDELVDAPFTIDIWSDVVCPFCALGEAQLRHALAQFEQRDQVVIQFHAFELDTHAKASYDQPIAELVARKYSSEISAVERHQRSMEAEATKLGLTLDFTKVRHANTFDAHRLIALAKSQGLGNAMVDRLFAAYFAEGELVSDHATLVRLADEVGVHGAAATLASDLYADEVRADEEAASELGISGVPAMVLDGRFMVVGAQGVDALTNVLARAWARRQSLTT
jgi:predicted DsbA family dithiol-disulfide isomerase